MSLTCDEATLDRLVEQLKTNPEQGEKDSLAALLAAHLTQQFGEPGSEALVREGVPAIAGAYGALDDSLITDFAGRKRHAARERVVMLWELFGDDVHGRVADAVSGLWRPQQLFPGVKRRRQGKYKRDPQETLSMPSVVRVMEAGQSTVLRDTETTMQGYRAVLSRPLKVSGIPSPGALVQLSRRFPWMQSAILEISQAVQLAQTLKARRAPLPPILLLGPPGIGKSRFCIELAEALGRNAFLQPMSSLHESFTISGGARSYHHSDASIVVRAMCQHRCADPLIVLDELDKAGTSDNHGNAHSALLNWLEPTTARFAHDQFLDTAIDARFVSWIATANDLANLPKPLRSRLRCIEVGRPRVEHVDTILEGFATGLARTYEVPRSHVPQPGAATRDRLVSVLRDTGDLRRMEAEWRKAILRPALGVVGRQAAN